uniref:hypothetical protein n=1 Tax=Algoriphagus sp. TaxID=1872435 RepID=UPI004047FEFE
AANEIQGRSFCQAKKIKDGNKDWGVVSTIQRITIENKKSLNNTRFIACNYLLVDYFNQNYGVGLLH